METPSSSRKLNYDDFQELYEDSKRHQVIDGQHYVTPNPSPQHQAILINLLTLIHMFLEDHPLGETYFLSMAVALSPHDIVQPDILFISNERASIITETHIFGAPDLMVEILADETRHIDEILKRRLYETAGVREYWMVDPERETVAIDRAVDGAYQRVAEVGLADVVLTTLLIPGLEIPLARVFDDARELAWPRPG